jgi:RNA polymerase sigma factor (sigma-70 family)
MKNFRPVVTDNELMLKIINGDTDKIGMLYERYNKMLFGYFFKLTKNQELSEDLVNDVFLKILKSTDKYRGDGIFRVWMFRIAHNVFIDNYHKTKRVIIEEQIFAREKQTDTMEDSHLILERSENKLLVHQALLKLKKKEHEVLVLCKLDGLKYREVAGILNCSEEAVKVRTFRAMQNLKNILQKMQN